jgi:hypothetical protein
MGLREKRLRSDWDLVRRLFEPGLRIHLSESEGDPPERYRIEYRVRGLVVQDGKLQIAERHLVEIFLTLAYPRQAPQCRMLTPVFHPNIAPHAICIGDHWSAGESLAALIVRIAEMLCYQSYNVKSPLNGDAARWAEEHLGEIPLERFDFGRLLGQGTGIPPVVPPSPDPGLPREAGPAEAPLSITSSMGGIRPSEDPPAPGRAIPRRPDPVGNSHDAQGGPAEGGDVVCRHCGATLSLPPGRALAWARCPLCGRMVKAANE